jgi:Arylsulfotransferase (ASST)
VRVRTAAPAQATRCAATLIAALALAAGPLALTASASPAPACAPATIGRSAALAHGAVTVSPAPGSLDASYLTQISFLGAPPGSLSHLSVVGSRSGSHTGRLAAYSQGDGQSFLPSRPFTQGEQVTVSGVLRQGAQTTPLTWSFTVAQVDSVSRSLETPPGPPPAPDAGELQHFVSRPELRPPVVTVTANTGDQEPGDLFLAPYAGPGQYGPMILDASGRLVWFSPLPSGARAADLRVQQLDGRPVLTWWQDPVISGGRRDAAVVIANSAYSPIALVRAGNGYQPDLHAFQITPQRTALFTVYDAIRCDLSAYGGPADGAVADTLYQEVDLATGLVRYEWHALDHVPLSSSYQPARPGSPTSPWDYFHINAVYPQGADVLVDSRNTWAAYEIHARTGQVAWRLGGKHSSFSMGPGASPAWQHDVRMDPDGTISFFDNGATPRVHPQSRVIVLSLDTQHMTAALVSSFVHPTPLVAPSQGDFQPLADGSWQVGWGQEPYFSDFGPTGQLLFDAHLPSAYQSYTVFKFPWTGDPASRPQVAVHRHGRHGVVVYVSWNGATNVARWSVLAVSSAGRLAPVAALGTSGFETTIPLPSASRYLAVQALDAQGNVLATSRTVAGTPP